MMKTQLGAGWIVVLLMMFGGSALADGRMSRFHGSHPIPKKAGGGFCYLDVPHVHAWAPQDPRMFRQVEGEYVFVGDPAPFDYDGPKYSYYGPHPLVVVDVDPGPPIYCYLDGPHFHLTMPAPEAKFELKGGAYWYVGPFEPVYERERPRYAVINDAYRPIEYARPEVDVSAAPPGVHVAVAVPSPEVHIAVPTPSLNIHIGAFPVVVPVVHEHVIVHDEGPHWHHDNGRHEGWHKGKHH